MKQTEIENVDRNVSLTVKLNLLRDLKNKHTLNEWFSKWVTGPSSPNPPHSISNNSNSVRSSWDQERLPFKKK